MELRIVHVNFSDSGGAAQAAIRLHKALLQVGAKSSLLVAQKTRDDIPEIHLIDRTLRSKFKGLVGRVFNSKRTPLQEFYEETKVLQSKCEAYSPPFSAFSLEEHQLIREADIIHLHWVSGMIDYQSFFNRIKKPVFWTLHDMNPFLGGYHYELDFLKDQYFLSIEEKLIQYKVEALQKAGNLHVICPSKWIMQKSMESRVLGPFRHHLMVNPIDINIFGFKEGVRLNSGTFNIGFIAENLSNRRKGFDLLKSAISHSAIKNVKFYAAGNSDGSNKSENVESVGFINSEKDMASFLNSLNAFIIPSLEDNLPNTVVESLCCGTPVLAFEVGGLSEMIDNSSNGVLLQNSGLQSLLALIESAFEKKEDWNREQISAEAQEKYGSKKVLQTYFSIIDQALN